MRQLLIVLAVAIVGAAGALFLFAHSRVTTAAPPPASAPAPTPTPTPTLLSTPVPSPPPTVSSTPVPVLPSLPVSARRGHPRRKAKPTVEETTDPRVSALVQIIADPHRSIEDRMAWAESEFKTREIGHVRDSQPQ
jgi:hypothetical protein